MENTTVTITLKEYDHLRDKAQINLLVMDRITSMDVRLRELENRMYTKSGLSDTSIVTGNGIR